MKCTKKRLTDFIESHDLEKYYQNTPLINKYLPQTNKDKKKKQIFLVAGLLAVVAGIAYLVLRNREDFYGDDFYFDDEDDLFYEDEEFDLYDEDEEDEFEDLE